jgi:putative tryptophan/tyrosine transport system substrate-binding protein
MLSRALSDAGEALDEAPRVGYLSQRSPTDSASIVAAFRQGLKEQGYVDGQNVAIESRFAEGQIDRLRQIWFGMA